METIFKIFLFLVLGFLWNGSVCTAAETCPYHPQQKVEVRRGETWQKAVILDCPVGKNSCKVHWEDLKISGESVVSCDRIVNPPSTH